MMILAENSFHRQAREIFETKILLFLPMTNQREYDILNVREERVIFVAILCHTEYAIQKKAKLEASLLNLMQQQYSEITVTDICRESGIPRRTFYHYFESKEDALNSIIEELMHQCFLEVMFEFRLGMIDMKESFVRIFRFWEGTNRAKLDALIRNGLESRLMTWSLQFIRAEKIGFLSNSNLDPKLVEIGLMVGVTDFFTLLFYWSRGGYQETPEQMAEYAIWILPQAFYNLENVRMDL